MDIDNKVVNYWITKSLNKNYQTSLVKSGTTATIPQKVWNIGLYLFRSNRICMLFQIHIGD